MGAEFGARAEILRRIEAALGGGMAAQGIPREYARTLDPGTDIVDLFVERVSDYRAQVKRVAAAALAGAIGRSLSERDATRIAIPPELPAEWLAESRAEQVPDRPPLDYATLDGLDGVITGCSVAIAETGTIILDSGPAQGRRVLSLLPDYHLCVVFRDQIVGSVPEALERLDARRPQTWISGPSATSDIELQRVEGVHGPRNLEVLVVE